MCVEEISVMKTGVFTINITMLVTLAGWYRIRHQQHPSTTERHIWTKHGQEHSTNYRPYA